ncbi:MAG: DUF1697 domain-containing protein [Chloroflexota bacterium]
MPRHIALLRGINVGGHNTVPMADLRHLLLDLGHTSVVSHLQSGNVVYSSRGEPPSEAVEIEEQLQQRLGLAIRVLIRTQDELAQIIDQNPFTDIVTDPSRFLVSFLFAPPNSGAIEEIQGTFFEAEAFSARERELYLWCPDGVRESRLLKAVSEKRLGVAATNRNWNTVTRLLALADSC